MDRPVSVVKPMYNSRTSSSPGRGGGGYADDGGFRPSVRYADYSPPGYSRGSGGVSSPRSPRTRPAASVNRSSYSRPATNANPNARPPSVTFASIKRPPGYGSSYGGGGGAVAAVPASPPPVDTVSVGSPARTGGGGGSSKTYEFLRVPEGGRLHLPVGTIERVVQATYRIENKATKQEGLCKDVTHQIIQKLVDGGLDLAVSNHELGIAHDPYPTISKTLVVTYVPTPDQGIVEQVIAEGCSLYIPPNTIGQILSAEYKLPYDQSTGHGWALDITPVIYGLVQNGGIKTLQVSRATLNIPNDPFPRSPKVLRLVYTRRRQSPAEARAAEMGMGSPPPHHSHHHHHHPSHNGMGMQEASAYGSREVSHPNAGGVDPYRYHAPESASPIMARGGGGSGMPQHRRITPAAGGGGGAGYITPTDHTNLLMAMISLLTSVEHYGSAAEGDVHRITQMLEYYPDDLDPVAFAARAVAQANPHAAFWGSPVSVLTHIGFQEPNAAQALRMTGGSLPEAFKLLINRSR